MKVKVHIPTVQQMTNTQAFVLFCVIVSITNNPDSDFNDIVRLSGMVSTTVFEHFKRLEQLDVISIDRTQYKNRYTYNEPKNLFVTVDSSLLDLDVDRVAIGFLVKFKTYTRIATNMVDLSLNRIVKEVGVEHKTVYNLLDKGILSRGEKKLYFTILHPALTTII